METRHAEMETQRAEIEAERAAQQETWAALTDAQKEELYALHDATLDAQIAVIDKQLSLGLLTEENAAQMKESLEAQKTAIRESGVMPFPGGKGGHPGQGGKPGGHPMRPPTDMDMPAGEITPSNTQL
jgi:hypothetical protein